MSPRPGHSPNISILNRSKNPEESDTTWPPPLPCSTTTATPSSITPLKSTLGPNRHPPHEHYHPSPQRTSICGCRDHWFNGVVLNIQLDIRGGIPSVNLVV
ncbi:hypothetical protein NMY22_g13851 [Coprinellus aureogranulatus]|nr:hypothetical protein NMY22_g13851 [Coprinellus aureogranulatus]